MQDRINAAKFASFVEWADKARAWEDEQHRLRQDAIWNESLARLDAEEEVRLAKIATWEMEQEIAYNTRQAIQASAESGIAAFRGFFDFLSSHGNKTAGKIAKVLLFMEGSMAVTRGVIALQTAFAEVYQSKGLSLMQVPGAITLIASGTQMIAGAFLKSGGSSRAGPGGGHGPRMSTGQRGESGGAQIVNINIRADGIVHDEGQLGERVSRAISRARQEGRVS